VKAKFLYGGRTIKGVVEKGKIRICQHRANVKSTGCE